MLGANGPYSTAANTTSLPAWPCGSGGGDLWLSYDAPPASIVTFSTCNAGTTFDTVLQVFGGACGALTSLGCNDDDASCRTALRSTLTVTVAQATALFVRVGGFQGVTGTFQLDVTRKPTNDTCAQPVTLLNGPNGPFANVGATQTLAWPCGLTPNDIWSNGRRRAAARWSSTRAVQAARSTRCCRCSAVRAAP